VPTVLKSNLIKGYGPKVRAALYPTILYFNVFLKSKSLVFSTFQCKLKIKFKNVITIEDMHKENTFFTNLIFALSTLQKMLGCFNPILGQIWTNLAIGLHF